MKIIYMLIIFTLLTSCSDDTPEVLQNSFTSMPTDKQVMAFLKKEGRYDIELSDNPGEFSTYQLRKRWQKGYAYKVNPQVENNPDAVLQVGGFVRFEVNGNNFDFAGVKQLTTEITGFEPPEESVLLEIINNNMQKFYPNYRNIVFKEPVIKLAEKEADRNIFWYSTLSFRIDFDMSFHVKSGGRKVDKVHCTKGVRFYRKDVGSPFDRLLQEAKDCNTLESKVYSYAELEKIPTIESIKIDKVVR